MPSASSNPTPRYRAAIFTLLFGIGLVLNISQVNAQTRSVSPLTLQPNPVLAQTPTVVTVTTTIQGAGYLAGSANLQRLGSNGLWYVLGSLTDSGNGVFTFSLNVNEPSPITMSFRASAAYRGVLKRELSSVANLSVVAPPPTVQGPISYVYDRLGRLIAVIDPASDTAVYQYDAVGNLLSITRQSSAIVSIINFSPRSGISGTTVTLSGTGFSNTMSQNTVRFNGIPATVMSSSSTQLVVQTPSGVTTGPIAVTTPNGSATSASSFTVTP